jgi:hypothetical protein
MAGEQDSVAVFQPKAGDTMIESGSGQADCMEHRLPSAEPWGP